MKVKELIQKLSEEDPELRVVIDLIEGAYDIDENLCNGGLGHPLYEKVIWITPKEKAKK